MFNLKKNIMEIMTNVLNSLGIKAFFTKDIKTFAFSGRRSWGKYYISPIYNPKKKKIRGYVLLLH